MIGDRWGVSGEETARTYPCDRLVPSPAMEAWRGITVDAPAEHVWRWVRQIRLAPYSYDWIDNLGRTSPRELRDLDDPRVGDPFLACAGRPLGEVLAVDPGRELTGEILGAVMSYVLVPVGARRTRLLLKIVMRRHRWAAPAVSVGDLVMARKQLLTWKELAERLPA
ncbi:hypothetical protein KLP28_16370 [Nocardioidaceae bacterium]|nr:hypothetical protein KLP28_16370 [Nocardioidaceae bacterium]